MAVISWILLFFPFASALFSPYVNITGYYKGMWQNSNFGETNSALVDFNQVNRLEFQHKSGEVVYKITTRPTAHPSIYILVGEMVIRDGEWSSSQDIYMPIAGILSSRSGKISLFGTKSSLLTLSLDQKAVESTLNNTKIDPFDHLVNLVKIKATLPTKKLETSSIDEYTITMIESNSTFKEISVEKQKQILKGSTKMTPISNSRLPGCFFQVFLQISLQPLTVDLTDANPVQTIHDRTWKEGNIDDKSRQKSILERLAMNGAINSPNCKVKMTINATALSVDKFQNKARSYALMATIISFIQVMLLVHQMDYTSTAAWASKVSLLTIGHQAILDSYLCLIHLTAGILIEPLFNAFVPAAFFKFVGFSLFEMRYLLVIWKSRRPQDDSWVSMRRELSMMYSRFYTCLLCGIFLIYQLQILYPYILFLLYSFWVPQIINNAQKDFRNPLHPTYLIGTSITRLFLPLYILLCPQNMFQTQPRIIFSLSLVAYVALQVVILLKQSSNPRFFIPAQFLPQRYNYQRTITPQLLSRIQQESENDTNVHNTNCVICLSPVNIHSYYTGSLTQLENRTNMGDSYDSDELSRAESGTMQQIYAITPCNHIFHLACLQQWSDYKMECPTCRQEIPPL